MLAQDVPVLLTRGEYDEVSAGTALQAGCAVSHAAHTLRCAVLCAALCTAVLCAVQGVPVLLTRGEYDEVSAASALQVAAGLPSSGGQVVTFKGSGSYMHLGELRLF
jgi:predicted esterase